jgi:lysophospholipase L1-like esterase
MQTKKFSTKLFFAFLFLFALNGSGQTLDPDVHTSRVINTTPPLTGTHDLSIDITLGITRANAGQDGYLNKDDYNRFNLKLSPNGNGSELTGFIPGQIPGLPASKITSGQLPLARGGTNSSGFSGIVKSNGTSYVVAANNVDYLAPVTVSPGSFTKITIDAYGRVTSGTTASFSEIGGVASASQIPDLDVSKVTTGVWPVNRLGTGGTSSGVKFLNDLGNFVYPLTGLTGLGTANQLLGVNNAATAFEYKTLSVGSSGTDFAISHSAGGVAFNLPTASATNRGALSSTDWSLFNSKEHVLTFTLPLLRTSNDISINPATGTNPGSMSSADKAKLDAFIFSAGNLSPLFTSSVATAGTTPALSFSLASAAAYSWFGNATGSSAAPAYNTSVFPAQLMPAYSGDASSSAGSLSLTVTRINGASLAGLATGILKNTTTTGVPSIAVAADFPTLNQNTTGNAATVTTNANLTGPITSSGNATSIAAQTGTGTTFAMSAGPTFTGVPAAPTAAADTNTTQISTTAFVLGQAGTGTPIVDGTGAAGTSLRYARQDHVHPTDTSREPSITSGTALQFWHGNKTWGVLVAGDIPSTLNSTTVNQVLTLTGASNGLWWSERDAVGNDWVAYASGGLFHLWNGTDRFAIYANGDVTSTGIISAANGTLIGNGDTGTVTSTMLANSAVTLAKMANMATDSLIYRRTAGTGAPEVNTRATLKTDMALNLVENTALSTWTGSTNLTTLGTITGGTWNGSIITGTYGGTGVNNGTKIITLGNNFTTSGNFALTLTQTATTNVTLPTTGTLATLAGSEALTNKDMSGAGNTWPTFNQSTTGSAATLTTARNIGGASFNGSANITVDSILTLSSTGLLSRTSANTLTPRTITGTTNQISVSNGDGVSGNPTLSVPAGAQLSIAKNTLLTSNGFVKTSGSDGTLSVANIAAADIPATLNATTFSGLLTASANATLTASGNPILRLNSTSANPDARNWAVSSNDVAWGDFTIRQGVSLGSDASTGTVSFTISRGGANASGGYTIGATGNYSPGIVFIGDSITQEFSPTLQTSKTVSTTNGSSTITFSSNVLTAADVGSGISGTGITGTEYIGAILSTTSATLSSDPLYNIPVNATATGSITATVTPWGYNNYFGVGSGTSPENFAVSALGTFEGLALSPANGQNVAVAGKTIEQLYETSYPLISKFRQESGMNIVVVLAGTNNLGLNTDTPELTFSKLAAFCTWLKSQPGNPRIIVLGLISRGGSNANGTYNSQVATVNGYIRRSWGQFADRFVDWNATVNGGSNEFQSNSGTAYSNTTYYSGDQLHPTSAGMKKMASYVQPVINDLLTFYFQTQRNQLFVHMNKGSHDNVYNDGMLTLANDNPSAGQSEINFAFNNGSGGYALKANIRASYLGELALGSTGSITEYIDPTYGPDVYGDGTHFATAVSYKTQGAIESLVPHRITSNSAAGFTTGKGLELNYSASIDWATIGAFDHASGGAWKSLNVSALQIKWSSNGADRGILDSSGNFGFGTTSPSWLVTIGSSSIEGLFSMDGPTTSGYGPLMRFTIAGTTKGYFGMARGIHNSTSDNLEVSLQASNAFIVTGGGFAVGDTNSTNPGAGNIEIGGNSSKGGALLFGNDGSLYVSYVLLSGTNYYNFAAGAHLIGDAFDVRSSRTYKRNIRDWTPQPDALDKFRAHEFERLGYDNQTEVGPIAEELKDVLPEAVSKDGKSVRPMALLTWALFELQKQKKEIEQLKARQHENPPDNHLGALPIRYGVQLLGADRERRDADNLPNSVLRR